MHFKLLGCLAVGLILGACENSPKIVSNPVNNLRSINSTKVEINLGEAFCDASCKEEDFIEINPEEDREYVNESELVVHTPDSESLDTLKSEFKDQLKEADDVIGDKLNTAVLKLEDEAEANQVWQELDTKDYVEHVEPNVMGEVQLPSLGAEGEPDVSDLFSTQQLSDPALNLNLVGDKGEAFVSGYGLILTKASEVWPISRGKGVIVAVLDTGVDKNHPDLMGKVLDGIDLINHDEDPDDDHFHGTHVSGIIAATDGNGTGIAGVAPDAQILPVKVLDENSNSRGSLTVALDTIARGIVWAVDRGAKVINMSLESPKSSQQLFKAIRYAEKKGVVVVAAMGNNRKNKVRFPAAYAMLSNLIAVSATQPDQKVWEGSNWGKWVSLAGPGYHIMSTLPSKGTPASENISETSENGLYGTRTGTSQAAPFISGVAALLMSQNPKLSPKEVKHLIMKSADDLGAKTGFDNNYGMGMVNAKKAIDLMLKSDNVDIKTPPIVDIEGISASPFYINTGEKVTLTLKHASTDQALRYRWRVNGGTIQGNGKQVTWIAPSRAGKYQFLVGVQQGNRKAFFRSQTIVH